MKNLHESKSQNQHVYKLRIHLDLLFSRFCCLKCQLQFFSYCTFFNLQQHYIKIDKTTKTVYVDNKTTLHNNTNVYQRKLLNLLCCFLLDCLLLCLYFLFRCGTNSFTCDETEHETFFAFVQMVLSLINRFYRYKLVT